MAEAITPAEKVLGAARHYIGQHEQPWHSNRGPFVEACQRFTWLRGSGWPWCVAFVQRCMSEAGYQLPYRTAGAYDLLRWAKTVGWATSTPRAGAIAVWRIGTGHASIVESYDLHTHTVVTIDGNVGDQVQRCHRNITLAAGFVWHPALSRKPSQPVPVKPPRKLTVGSVSGRKKTFFRWKRDPLDGWVAVP